MIRISVLPIFDVFMGFCKYFYLINISFELWCELQSLPYQVISQGDTQSLSVKINKINITIKNFLTQILWLLLKVVQW